VRKISRIVGGLLLGLVGLALAAACGSTTSASGGGKQITIGYARGADGVPWIDQQERVVKALAQRRGWKVVVLDNKADGPTAVQNAKTFARLKVNYVIEFQVDSTVNPVISQVLSIAHIPVVTEDIPGPNEYFVGVNNYKAGIQGGTFLGKYAKAHWNCKPDLVVMVKADIAGDASRLRVAGGVAGLRSVCPNVPSSSIAYVDDNNNPSTAITGVRNVLSAHPSATHILTGGLNDDGVEATVTAATQLGRQAQVYGWGEDGSDLTPAAPPQLAGSVEYWLEGYPTYVFKYILDPLAAGKHVAMHDTVSDAAAYVDTCAISRAQGLKLPAMSDRVSALLKAAPGTTEAQLFCPKSAA
jgi:ABC-type sugar transport system substrate-binding protein